jgi:hypothetical protein
MPTRVSELLLTLAAIDGCSHVIAPHRDRGAASGSDDGGFPVGSRLTGDGMRDVDSVPARRRTMMIVACLARDRWRSPAWGRWGGSLPRGAQNTPRCREGQPNCESASQQLNHRGRRATDNRSPTPSGSPRTPGDPHDGLCLIVSLTRWRVGVVARGDRVLGSDATVASLRD